MNDCNIFFCFELFISQQVKPPGKQSLFDCLMTDLKKELENPSNNSPYICSLQSPRMKMVLI
jgi:hypothetical protein